MTLVVVTHELSSAFAIADRLMLLENGAVVAVDTVEAFRGSAHPLVRQFLDRRPDPPSTRDAEYLATAADGLNVRMPAVSE